MQFQQINRDDPEKVFAAIKNAAGTTMSAGAAAFYVVSSGDGISVSNAGSVRQWAFAGIVKSALDNGDYGRAQVYGICSAYMVLDDSTVSAVPGTQLVAVASADYLKNLDATELFTFVAVSSAALTWTGGTPWNFVTLMDTFASAASANSVPALKSVFVRAL